MGPSGSGRHTRALCMLKQIYGVNTITPISSTITYTTSTQQNELTVLTSPYHLEINPSMVGQQDQYIITSVIKEAATTKSVNSQFKVIFIQQADRLSQLAQQALRRLMEENAQICKLFMFCENASGLLAPVRSRMFTIRLPAVTKQQMLGCYQKVKSRVKGKLTDAQLGECVEEADGNMRRFLLLAQALQVTQETINETRLVLPKWEARADELFQKFFVQGADLSADLRAGLVEILKMGVPAEQILEWFFKRIVRLQPLNLKFMNFVAAQACEYDSRLRQAQIGLIHLEAFICVVLHAQRIRL